MKRVLRRALNRLGVDVVRVSSAEAAPACPPDITPANARIYDQVRGCTMCSPERINAFIEAVRHVERHRVEGAIVECGVWKGGAMMSAALALLESGEPSRELYLYDTYEGMSEPGAQDVSLSGERATDRFSRSQTEQSGWCRSSLDEVRRNLEGARYPPALLHFVEGRVEDTIPAVLPSKIAVLRLDTDWYESTRHELVHLFPLLQKDGVLIIDDYGHWQGARAAVDEYIEQRGLRLLLHRIDYTCRVAVKT